MGLAKASGSIYGLAKGVTHHLLENVFDYVGGGVCWATTTIKSEST